MGEAAGIFSFFRVSPLAIVFLVGFEIMNGLQGMVHESMQPCKLSMERILCNRPGLTLAASTGTNSHLLTRTLS